MMECALQLVYSSKEAAGNKKAIAAHQEVDDAADAMKEALKVKLHSLTCRVW